MTSTVYVHGKPCQLDPSKIIGQGGEAVVYLLSEKQALKVYLRPDDPMFAGNPAAQKAAQDRLAEHQRKLPAFPKVVPANLVAPNALAYDTAASNLIVGYTMPFLNGHEVLLRYSERTFREAGGIDPNLVVKIFLNLHKAVGEIHGAGIVIGDFNDLNVLVSPDNQGEAFLVDADSMQFDRFLGRTFTGRFVDPLHCPANELELVRPHSQTSDWYAFATMLFQSLLYINPYGGVHRPKQGKRLRDAARILNRVTVFSPDVLYPKAALPLSVLPDELLHYFSQLYEQDTRGVFPLNLLLSLRWTACQACDNIHARGICPSCAKPGAVTQAVTMRGDITATRKFQTKGQILFATIQNGELRYLYHEGGIYRREGGREVWSGPLDSDLRVRIWNQRTVFAKNTSIVVLDRDNTRKYIRTQTVGRLPILAANDQHLYWIEAGNLVRDSDFGSSSSIGRILSGRTLIWTGEKFGFGFYQAGALTRGLIFNTERSGINDSVPLPPMPGNLIDATCVFSQKFVWFMITIQISGEIWHRCFVFNDLGQAVALAEAKQGEDSWLGASIRGHFATGNYLYAATDQGIIRVVLHDGKISPDRIYADTEPFVNTNTQLLPSGEGILAVSGNEIVLLQFRQP